MAWFTIVIWNDLIIKGFEQLVFPLVIKSFMLLDLLTQKLVFPLVYLDL